MIRHDMLENLKFIESPDVPFPLLHSSKEAPAACLWEYRLCSRSSESGSAYSRWSKANLPEMEMEQDLGSDLQDIKTSDLLY